MPALFRRPLVAAIISLFTTVSFAQGGPGDMPPTLVETITPTVSTVSDSVETVGTIFANESIVLRPEVSGRLQHIYFEEGQAVKKGAKLFALDASLALAEVAEQQATLDQSQRELKRAEELLAQKLISQSDVDSKRALAKIDQARLASARARLAKTQIHAAFDGIMGLREVSPGEYVDSGQALASLVQIQPLKLQFNLAEIYLAQVHSGLPLTLRVDAFAKKTFNGSVYAIDPELNMKSRSVKIRAQVDNAEGLLRPGLFARISLKLGERSNSMKIPEQALWPQGGKQNVYIVNNGSAELIEVQIGARSNGQVEILSGLKAEHVVISAGQLKIFPGAPVQTAAAANPQ